LYALLLPLTCSISQSLLFLVDIAGAVYCSVVAVILISLVLSRYGLLSSRLCDSIKKVYQFGCYSSRRTSIAVALPPWALPPLMSAEGLAVGFQPELRFARTQCLSFSAISRCRISFTRASDALSLLEMPIGLWFSLCSRGWSWW
jgi:hypothetical protein